jgi:uncharacterized membrane protein
MTAYHPAYAPAAPPSALSRGLALLAYGLLFLGPITFGGSALLGVILAYARRDGAAPLIRSHHRFQIRLFWIALLLFAGSGALGVSAAVQAVGAPPAFSIPRSPKAEIAVWRPDAEDSLPEVRGARLQPAQFEAFTDRLDDRGLYWGVLARNEGYAALALLILAGLWSVLAPLWGAVRLASGRPMGQSAV